MLPLDRRTFLGFLSSAALTSTFGKSIERALAVPGHLENGRDSVSDPAFGGSVGLATEG
jgi:hypothetical protein